MEELIKEIKETKDKLKSAQDASSPDREEISFLRSLILELQNLLLELQKKENILLARESASSASAGIHSSIVIYNPLYNQRIPIVLIILWLSLKLSSSSYLGSSSSRSEFFVCFCAVLSNSTASTLSNVYSFQLG